MIEKAEIQKEAKPYSLGLIAISFIAGIIGICILLIRANVYSPLLSEFLARNLEFLFGICSLIAGYLAVKRMYGRKANFTLGIILFFLFLQIFLQFIINSFRISFFSAWIIFISITLISIICLLLLFIYPVINSMDRWAFGIRGKFKNDIFVYSGIAMGLFLCGIWFTETFSRY